MGVMHDLAMLASSFSCERGHTIHVQVASQPEEFCTSLQPMIGNVEAREAASVRWARTRTILFRSLWQDGLEVRRDLSVYMINKFLFPNSARSSVQEWLVCYPDIPSTRSRC